MNGRTDQATQTKSVNQQTMTLRNMDDDADAVLYTDNDGEAGVWCLFCDTNLENLEYALVVSNTATAVTVTPALDGSPAAGWYWFLGGINPVWRKWFDFGSPQHKQKIFGVAITVEPVTGTDGNRMALHGMQELDTEIRARVVQDLGGTNDLVNTLNLSDRYATHHGLELNRPNAVHDFKLVSITIEHAPRV